MPSSTRRLYERIEKYFEDSKSQNYNRLAGTGEPTKGDVTSLLCARTVIET